ncbi:MAG: 50S ribosomal protein L29 [Armatimonadota bacterium]
MDERRRLHELTKEQLNTELADAERNLLDLQFDKGLKRLTNPAALHNTRKRIALLKTLIRQRELLAETGLSSMEEYKAFRVSEKHEYAGRKKAQ